MQIKVKKLLEKQGYRIIGKHTAIKICLWCKKAIRNENTCYKHKFYGIKSWRCIQMSPAFLNCLHRCQFCWRYLDYTLAKDVEKPDDPNTIIDGCINAQREILQGFLGNKKIGKKRFYEAMNPKHFALSLAGDACMYPKLPQFIDEIHKRKMTTFLVTNGTKPEMLKKLLKHKPTQLYITLPAPNKKIYKKICKPTIKDGWERLMESLNLMKNFNRPTIRLTLAKELNMCNVKDYANIIKDLNFKFLECKAAMPVGYARHRITYEQMPTHKELRTFTTKLAELLKLKIIDEKEESRVFLLSKKDSADRKLFK
ncbi:4-demethylwyosine synthase TYW1 [archaeon]|nr:4-demethylwyosine synthase TYW1 [archaeon]|tara:strand:+ start:75 stop:1010 length:936 start_codon:yes stop_codon:yes gene_type:complete